MRILIAISASIAFAIVIGCQFAFAGDTVSFTLPDVWPTNAAGWGALLWSWVQPYFTVSGVVALLMAVLPQGPAGSLWDKVRTLLNFVASNWGNAKNVKL